MSIRKRTVRIDHYYCKQFNISFKSYLHVQLVTLLLNLKRWYRRIKRGFGYCKYSFFIIPLWAIFAVCIYYWGKSRSISFNISDVLWDMKYSFFSSVIIASATAFFTQFSKDKYKFQIQHHYYINAMDCFSKLYDSLLEISVGKRSGIKPPFEPFYYSNNIFDKLEGVFPKTLILNKEKNELEPLLHRIQSVRTTILEISEMASEGTLDGCSYVECREYIERCLNQLDFFEERVQRTDIVENWNNMAVDCISQLYEVLELVRRPWRRDLQYKLDILKAIYEQDKSIACTFYIEAFLGVVDYDFYNMSDEDFLMSIKNSKT